MNDFEHFTFKSVLKKIWPMKCCKSLYLGTGRLTMQRGHTVRSRSWLTDMWRSSCTGRCSRWASGCRASSPTCRPAPCTRSPSPTQTERQIQRRVLRSATSAAPAKAMAPRLTPQLEGKQDRCRDLKESNGSIILMKKHLLEQNCLHYRLTQWNAQTQFCFYNSNEILFNWK